MLYMDDTLDEEDVLMIFDELEEQNLPFRCRRGADNELPACATCHGQLRIRAMTKQLVVIL